MTEFTKALIFLIFGVVILLTAIFTKAGVAIIVFGALLTLTALAFILWDKFGKKKACCDCKCEPECACVKAEEAKKEEVKVEAKEEVVEKPVDSEAKPKKKTYKPKKKKEIAE